MQIKQGIIQKQSHRNIKTGQRQCSLTDPWSRYTAGRANINDRWPTVLWAAWRTVVQQ